MPTKLGQTGAILKNAVIAYKGRDIVRVSIKGHLQPFYRSSGRSSGMPGTWLPFDGIDYPGTFMEWFDKRKYVTDPNEAWNKYGYGELHRFGTQEYKDISDELGKLNIPHVEDVDSGIQVNEFLGVKVEMTQHYKSLKKLKPLTKYANKV